MIPPRVLIVAGSDSGGGAGIQADIKTVTMFGGHAMTAVTAITAQNSLGVDQIMPVPVELVLRQIDVVLSDLGADVIKLGMIGSAETLLAVAQRLVTVDVPIVFDPVMVSTSGAALADDETIELFGRLLRLSTVSTPNLPELSALTGERIKDLESLEEAALKLARQLGRAILAKGGHLDSPVLTDVLVVSHGKLTRLEAERVETTTPHGTGCTLASAIACGLGQGRDLADSVTRARAFVQAAIREAPGFGAGHGPLGHALGTVPWNLIHKISE